MSISKTSAGRLRVQVYHQGRMVAASQLLGTEPKTFPDTRAGRREAQQLEREAERRACSRRDAMTLREFADRWTNDPLFARPKESTNLLNAERIRRFVARYADLPLERVTDAIVSEWINKGQNLATIPSLRAMFNDAASAKAGRLVGHNPFARLGIGKGKGNRHKEPPPEGVIWELIRAASRIACPSFAAWLQVACHTGMRPGELDALRWDAVEFDNGRIRVKEQFSAKSRTFTLPKNGQRRVAPLTPPAREALLDLPRDGRFCFETIRGTHFTPSARAYHWKATRAAVGFEGTLYLATRHYAGAYMVNTLGLDPEDVAVALGHEDGGYLVRTLYGHLDHELALERVMRAYERVGNVRPLRAVRESA